MAESPQIEIRIGGLGGQGLVTVGAVLAEAGAMAGFNVAASQFYGSQARGGTTCSDVILSREWIDFPHVEKPHLLLVLAQEAYENFLPGLAVGAVVLADGFFVKVSPRPALRQICVDATTLALDRLGNKLASNFVMLGALCGYTGLLERDFLEQAVDRLVSKRFRELNLKALELGWERGEALCAPEELGPWR